MSDSLPKHKQSLPIDSIKGKKLIPISEAAKILGVSIDTVRRWDKSGVLHSERPDGKNRYFSLDELEKHKVSQPLSISEVAKKLGISSTTLRRLEERGLIKPKRNSAGERVYDEDLLKNFLNSDYFLRKKQIKEKILEPFQEEKELIDSITLESETEHLERREPASNEPADEETVIPHIGLRPRPRRRINEFITVSAITFVLLVTFGIRNIWASEFNNANPLPTTTASEVLSVVKEEVSTTPADAVTESEATSAANLKTTVRVKTDEDSTVNIRQKPTTKSAKIGQAKDGDTFEFISKDSDWFEVKIASASGFISTEYVGEGN